MGLESASWISDLVATNPVGATDTKSQGDDHMRMLKAVLQACFPNAGKAFYFPKAEAKTADFTVTAAHMGRTFTVSTASGVVTATLPTLAAEDDGWECHFLKTNTGTNALYIAPTSGTLQSGEISGLAKCRRVIPGHRCTAHWTGSSWFVSRAPSLPIGTILETPLATVPVGYELVYGQTLASASTDYPEYYAANGNSGVVPDDRGRVAAGQDDMGGSSANRLTGLTGGVNGDTLGATGGEEAHTLLTAGMPVHTHSVTDPTHSHGGGDLYDATAFTNQFGTGTSGAISTVNNTAGSNTDAAATGISLANTGSGSAHNNVQPTIVRNKMIIVE